MLELRPADREAVVTGLAQLVSDPNAGSSEHRLELAKQSLNAVNSVEPTRRLLAALPGLGTLEALPLAEAYVDHPQLAETAEAALTDIRRSAWRASASHMTEIAENAIDRDPSSRWHTGAQQEGGEWFQLDLGAPYTLSGIALTLGEQAREGYPREYEVYLSLDGSDWGRPAAQGAGAAGTMSIEVAPRQARYVRIVQTGRGDGVFWAIDEIEVAAD
jgi:hypothetical protein